MEGDGKEEAKKMRTMWRTKLRRNWSMEDQIEDEMK